MENKKRVKQVLIIRDDLNMPRGKLAAQAAHASMAIFFNMMKENVNKTEHQTEYTLKVSNPYMIEWIEGHFTKICVYVKSEEALLKIHQKAQEANLPCSLIRDSGFTVFAEPTLTAVAIGPDDPDKIDAITKKLQLLK